MRLRNGSPAMISTWQSLPACCRRGSCRRGVCQDELVIIAPPNSPLTRARALKPNQLDAETWLLREEGSDTRRQTVMWWHRHRVAPTRTMTFDNPDAVKRAVMAGLGVVMVFRLTVAEGLSSRRDAVGSVQ